MALKTFVLGFFCWFCRSRRGFWFQSWLVREWRWRPCLGNSGSAPDSKRLCTDLSLNLQMHGYFWPQNLRPAIRRGCYFPILMGDCALLVCYGTVVCAYRLKGVLLSIPIPSCDLISGTQKRGEGKLTSSSWLTVYKIDIWGWITGSSTACALVNGRRLLFEYQRRLKNVQARSNSYASRWWFTIRDEAFLWNKKPDVMCSTNITITLIKFAEESSMVYVTCKHRLPSTQVPRPMGASPQTSDFSAPSSQGVSKKKKKLEIFNYSILKSRSKLHWREITNFYTR